jgi:membrane associated rhomboid family serine protease
VIPLNDTEPNRYGGIPIMTICLVLVNCLVMIAKPFLWEFMPLYTLFGSVPLQVFHQLGGGGLSSLTSTFLHSNLLHLGGNMVFLWVFGRRVEDACGPWRFLLFYLTCGLTADLLSTLIRFGDSIPGIGASGAIFGLEGAYLLLFPGSRIRTLLILWFVPTFPKIRAIWIVLYNFAIQIIPALEAAMNSTSHGINYWAHLGGFFGCVFVVFFLRPEAFARYLSNEPV